MLSHLLLFCAIFGLMCCTGFLVLVLIAVARFRRSCQQVSAEFTPPVSLFKPVHGLEPRLEENLESFFRQDYPNYEIIFGARQASDPAISIAEKLRKKYPHVPVKIVLSGEPDRPNAKVCTMEKMEMVADTGFFAISDSDVHVEPNYLREIMAPFADPKVGMVTCLYRGVPTGGLWSRLEALGMSVEMTSGAVVADMLEGMKFALGPTMVGRREAVEKAGGLGSLAEYCADDYVIGNRIDAAGYRVVMSQHAIDHVVVNRAFFKSIEHQVRWMKSTRFSRPKGHLGTALTFAMPFGVLGLIGGMIGHHTALGWEIFGYAVLNRILLSIASGWGAVRDRRSVSFCWLYPLRDLMGFGFWIASYSGDTIVWRNERYRLEYGGKMVPMSRAGDSASRTVTVDHLA